MKTVPALKGLNHTALLFRGSICVGLQATSLLQDYISPGAPALN